MNTPDDSGRPFEPATPEEFFQRGEEAFQIWWSELDPLRSSDGIAPDVEAARAVWLAAYEHSAPCILLVYDCAESSANAVPMSQAELAYVVHRHHNGSMTLPTQDFLDWVLPGDPTFGCYPGCNNNLDLYRPWMSDTPGNGSIMCHTTLVLEPGFTPVDRKILYDRLTLGADG